MLNRQRAKDHSELLVLSALLVVLVTAALVFKPPPFGVYAAGGVAGAAIVLQAIGLILVYRSNRIINFAQLQMGVLAGSLFLGLVHQRPMLHGLKFICPPCVPEPETVQDVAPLLDQLPPGLRSALQSDALLDQPLPESIDRDRLAVFLVPDWLSNLNYALSFVLSLAVGTFLIWLVYTVVIRRFNNASKLVLTVATIGAGGFMASAGGYLLQELFSPPDGEFGRSGDPAPIPVDISVSVGRTVFGPADLLTVGVAGTAVLGVWLYLRRSASGVVLRGAAENSQRAQTLGVNVNAVTSRIWIISGFLGGLSSILLASELGQTSISGASYLVRVLAAAVAGGLIGLPLTVLGALTVGLSDQLMLWLTGSQEIVTGILLVFITVVLLAQRARASRADVESAATWEPEREVRPTPPELSGLPVVRRTRRAGAVLLALVALGYPWIMTPSQVSLGTVTLLLAAVGLSLLVLTGWAGQISLGQMGFAAVGAWITAASALPLPLAVLLGGVAGGAVAGIVGLPALRLRGLFLAISTLAFGLAVSSLLLSDRYLGRALPVELDRPVLLGIDLGDDRAFYYLVLLFLLAVIAAVRGMRSSRFARALIACRDNEPAAQAFGINLLRARLTAFAASGFICATAGGLLVYAQFGIKLPTFAPEVSITVFLLAVLGGLGSVTGPIIGAVYYGLLTLASGSRLGPLISVLASPGLGVVLLLMFLPGGLSQAVFGMRDAWLRRIASRHRIVVPSLVADRKVDGEIPLAPKVRAGGGGAAFVPQRYRVEDQWMIESERARTKAGARG